MLTPKPNENGWNNSDVTVHVECKDEFSGVESCTPTEPVRLTEEGKDQVVKAAAKDKVGNTATLEIKVSIDKTKPTITATLIPSPNANGWNNVNVRVLVECRDALSGVASYTGVQTVSREGRDQQVTGEAVDSAGNRNTKTVRVNIDKTKPEVSLRLSDTSIQQGESISITITASDELSGIASVTANDNHLGSISLSPSGDRWEGTIKPSRSGRITVKVKDRADNLTSDSISYTVIELEPAGFRVLSIYISPGTSFPVGTRATISATIKNTGEKSGTQDIVLYIDGYREDYKQITLYPAESETVRFYYTFHYSGSYTIKVSSDDDYEHRTVTVIPEDHPPEIGDVYVTEVFPGHAGFARINVSIEFRDEDGDVESVLWKYADESDSDYRRIDVGDQASGRTSGTIRLENGNSLPCASGKTIYLRLEDEAGLRSDYKSIDRNDHC